MKLRIQFEKHGPMKFIGHLDTMRYFQKAIRRSGIDISYSTGFSPHQIMAFAAPLGVGVESDSEYLDIEVNSCEISSIQMVDILNAQMAEGFRIKSVVKLSDDAGNAMASVAAARYQVRFRKGKEPSFSIEEAINTFQTSNTCLVIKQTKKSEIELDLKPSVYELTSDGEQINMFVDASSAGNIKPDLVISYLYSIFKEDIKDNALLITRVETYGRDKEGVFIPLSGFGSEF